MEIVKKSNVTLYYVSTANIVKRVLNLKQGASIQSFMAVYLQVGLLFLNAKEFNNELFPSVQKYQ